MCLVSLAFDTIAFVSEVSSSLQDEAFVAVKDKAVGAVRDVKEEYKPQRRYKRHDASSITDEETRVHSTLLEYGR